MVRCINCDHCNIDEADIHYGECFIDGTRSENPYEKIECDEFIPRI